MDWKRVPTWFGGFCSMQGLGEGTSRNKKKELGDVLKGHGRN